MILQGSKKRLLFTGEVLSNRSFLYFLFELLFRKDSDE